MHSVSTSIRLSPMLSEQLRDASHALHRGKNWIITQALEEYLRKLGYGELAQEARRQSLLATQADAQDESWQENSDLSGWI